MIRETKKPIAEKEYICLVVDEEARYYNPNKYSEKQILKYGLNKYPKSEVFVFVECFGC